MPEDIGYELVYGKESDRVKSRTYLLKSGPEMTGKDIVKTSHGQDQNGQWVVSKTFNSQGASDFGRVTERLSKNN